MDALLVLKWLSLAIDLAPKAADAYQHVVASNAKAKEMVAENRNPTEEEWAAVGRDMDAEHAAIQAR